MVFLNEPAALRGPQGPQTTSRQEDVGQLRGFAVLDNFRDDEEALLHGRTVALGGWQ
jgi:hypothetical protein